MSERDADTKDIDSTNPFWSVISNGFEEYQVSTGSMSSLNEEEKFKRRNGAFCVILLIGSNVHHKSAFLEGIVLMDDYVGSSLKPLPDHCNYIINEYYVERSKLNSDGPILVLDIGGDLTDDDQLPEFAPALSFCLSISDILCVCDDDDSWLTSDKWRQLFLLITSTKRWNQCEQLRRPNLVVLLTKENKNGSRVSLQEERSIVQNEIRTFFRSSEIDILLVPEWEDFLWLENGSSFIYDWKDCLNDIAPLTQGHEDHSFSKSVRQTLRRTSMTIEQMDRSARFLATVIDGLFEEHTTSGNVFAQWSNVSAYRSTVHDIINRRIIDEEEIIDSGSLWDYTKCLRILKQVIDGRYGGIEFAIEHFRHIPPTDAEYERLRLEEVDRMENECLDELSLQAFELYTEECEHICFPQHPNHWRTTPQFHQQQQQARKQNYHYTERVHRSVCEKIFKWFRDGCNRKFGHIEESLKLKIDCNAEQLLQRLTTHWHTSGHQSCETVSLTGHMCMHPKHNLDDMAHETTFSFKSASDCGRAQASRNDPFTLTEANVEFYKNLRGVIADRKSQWLIEYYDVETNLMTTNSSDSMSSSWSLCRIGDYFDYDHEIGLTGQPGFLIPANFLAPLDLVTHKLVPLANIDDSVSSGNIAFVGCEYECHFGHRWISVQPNTLSSPNMNPIQSNFISDTLPLYSRCPERTRDMNSAVGANHLGQLMRLFVVCPPRSSIYLQPRVRHGLSNPLFSPSDRRIHLKDDSFFVLRFPLIYATSSGGGGELVALRPRIDDPGNLWPNQSHPSNSLRGHELLAGCIQVNN
ncbi:hypothetical protein ACOME3_009426 [Neoechinorhynchus agilis]